MLKKLKRISIESPVFFYVETANKITNVGLMPRACPKNSSKFSGQMLLHNLSSGWNKQTGNKDLIGESKESKYSFVAATR